jgi:hypothetical protein
VAVTLRGRQNNRTLGARDGLLAGPGFNLTVVPTAALASGTIVAIEVGAIASGYRGVPEITASKDAPVHMEDSAPAQISTVGSPNTIAGNVLSAYQANLLLLRLILKCSWTTRAPGMVQLISSATW